jgi:putative transposase
LELTKQSVHQMMQRRKHTVARGEEFIEKAEILRLKHPELGCRKMALKLKVSGFGRDKLEELFLTSGFRIVFPPNYTKTTQSIGINKYKNLVEGLLVKGINKVVQSDITYFWMNGRFGYLVFIIDVYSRLIVGYHASFGLQTEGNMKALAMMIKLRGKENVKGMIHHSELNMILKCIERR